MHQKIKPIAIITMTTATPAVTEAPATEETADASEAALRIAGLKGPTTMGDRKSTRLNSSHKTESRMPSSA